MEATDSNPDGSDGVTVDQQVTEGREAVVNALDALEESDTDTAEDELEIAVTLLGAAGIRTDPRLAALRQLFRRDSYTVEANGGTMGDFRIKFHNGTCIHDQRKRALTALGFRQGSTHLHLSEDDTPEMVLYVFDDTGGSR